MFLINLSHSITSYITKASTWLYDIQNTSRETTSSNYTLLAIAVGIICVGLFIQWITSSEARKKRIVAWWDARRSRKNSVAQETQNNKTGTPQEVVLPDMTTHVHVSSDGLTEEEAARRFAAGQNNITHVRTSRSYRHIFYSNIFTRFNALLSVMYVIILFVGTLQDSLFGLIVVLNSIIGIVQELRAKWTLDKLALEMTPQAIVIRGGKAKTIPASDIVVGDVIELTGGKQVAVDGIALEMTHLEVNESMITGESEAVIKKPGDPLYSGSFVLAGKCRIQAVCVGERSYARQLASVARHFVLSKSELRNGINQILRYVTWLLIPTALLLFITQILYMQHGWKDALAASAGGVVNMIPDGLVLLTSVVMALAIVRLSKKRVLIQELPAVEMLARINVLCLDKTGTLTEGTIVVERTITLPQQQNVPQADVGTVLAHFAYAQEQTSTLQAIGSAFPTKTKQWTITENIPFSSTRKWSALTFKEQGTWMLGAAEMILPAQEFSALQKTSELTQLVRSGKRVLLLSYSPKPVPRSADTKTFTAPTSSPIAFVVLQEALRLGVKKTLDYFKRQSVAIKIISGDTPETVGAVARQAGIIAGTPQNGLTMTKNIDELSKIVENNTVFGRILPEQKKLLLRALRQRGYVVAMVGDGLNDILAIKEADFSIAMGSGTDASRAIAQLVLLDNNFTSLPDIIAEGRRIIANIERTANLFITKTAYVILMSLAVGVALVPFPFLPRHLTLIGTFTVGVPALFLSFAKNNKRAHPGFVRRVFKFSLPSGMLIASLTLITYAITRLLVPGNIEIARTSATLALFGCGMSLTVLLAKPKTILQKSFIGALGVSMALFFVIPSWRASFGLELPQFFIWLILLVVVAICAYGLRKLKLVTSAHDIITP